MERKKLPREPFICPKYWLSDFVRIDGGIKIWMFMRPRIHLEKGATYKLKDRVLVTCNHNCWIEPPLLIRLFIRRRIYFVIAKELNKGNFTSWFYKRMNCITIDRDRSDLLAIKNIIKELNKDHLVVIFPEGQMSEDGSNKDFKNGAALLSLHTSSPILPLYIQRGETKWHRCHICVGNIIDPTQVGDGTKSKENQAFITDLVQKKTLELKEKLNKKLKLEKEKKIKKTKILDLE